MAWAYTIEGVDIWGRWRVKFGTYTNTGASTGGDIDTGLGNPMAVFLQKTGNGATTDLPVVNETFPDLGKPQVTIVTKAAESGVWIAIESESIQESYVDTTGDTTIFDYTNVGNKRFVIGNIIDDSGASVAMDLVSVLGAVDFIKFQTLDSTVEASQTVIQVADDALPIRASEGVEAIGTASATHLFLAIGTHGGTD